MEDIDIDLVSLPRYVMTVGYKGFIVHLLHKALFVRCFNIARHRHVYEALLTG